MESLATDAGSSEQGWDTVVSRMSSFVSAHRRELLLGTAAVVAAGGVGYYLYSSRGSSGDGDDLEPGAGPSSPRKKKTKSKKRKTVRDKDGPILEERKTTATVEEVAENVSVPAAIESLPPPLSEQEIAGMTTEEREAEANRLKTVGNDVYKKQKYDVAAELYTRAIAVTPKPEAVFYSNRSACYMNLKPPRYELVVVDCDAALRIDKNYVKALNRRGIAYEGLGRLDEALRDLTSAVIIDRFKNESGTASVDRVLKALSVQRAKELLAKREPRLPAATFVAAFFASFRSQPHPTLPDTPSQGDQTLKLAYDAYDAADYTHSFSLVNEAIDQGLSTPTGRASALNYRGTFKFLMGDTVGAKTDFEESVKEVPSFTNSWVKLASVHMDQGDPDAAFKAYDTALSHDPRELDVFYQRGQVRFIMQDYAKAVEDYTKATELDPTFVFGHVQLAVAQYKLEMIGPAMSGFRRTMRNFPGMSEPFNYYGELLLDQGKFAEAITKFDEAIAIEKTKKRHQNVLPFVNKGLALFQWKQDIAAAEKLCNEALEIDSECEAAIATLAQLLLQHGRLEEAVAMFARHVTIARTEAEVVATLNYQLATQAQLEFVKAYPEQRGILNQLARQMQ